MRLATCLVLLLCSLASADEWDRYLASVRPPAVDYSKMSTEDLINQVRRQAGMTDEISSAADELEATISRYAGEQVAMASDDHDYASMREEAIRTGEPLVVLLTRDYCAPCETMQHRLDGMAIDYAIVHYGKNPRQAVNIGTRGFTPELVVYDHVGPARHLEGVQSERRIREFLDGTRARAAAGEIRWPGPAHALRGTMCGSRGCQMCVGIALRNLGITPEGRSINTWLAQYDNHFNVKKNADSFNVAMPSEKDPYGETPTETVHAMLNIADLRPGETLYDLGSGDGRIAIAAAERGARAIGYEIDEDLVEEARKNAYGTQYVTFEQQDVTTADFPGADVLACYLTPAVTSRIDFGSLPSGVRIVCHEFQLEGVTPARTLEIADNKRIYLYETPLKTSYPGKGSAGSAASRPFVYCQSCAGGSCGVGRRLLGAVCRGCR